jgi:hypothetical protein
LDDRRFSRLGEVLALPAALWDDARMHRYDLAIHGFGLLPGLLAVHLIGRVPEQSLVLLTGDDTICGDALEPVLVSSLSRQAIDLVERFVVATWPGYIVTADGSAEHRTDEVLLLDPVQVWLELEGLLPPEALVLTGGTFVTKGQEIEWRGGSALSSQILDLAPITDQQQSSEILGLDAVRSLPLPVLADFDTGNEPWDAFQHIPLGDERVYVRKRICPGDAEAELTTKFGRTLSDLIAF